MPRTVYHCLSYHEYEELTDRHECAPIVIVSVQDSHIITFKCKECGDEWKLSKKLWDKHWKTPKKLFNENQVSGCLSSYQRDVDKTDKIIKRYSIASLFQDRARVAIQREEDLVIFNSLLNICEE